MLYAGNRRRGSNRRHRLSVYRKSEKGMFCLRSLPVSADGNSKCGCVVPVWYYLYAADLVQRLFPAERADLDRDVVLRGGFCGKAADAFYFSVPGNFMGAPEGGAETFCDDSRYVFIRDTAGFSGRTAVRGASWHLCLSGRQGSVVFVH